jgi:uncharacterized protein involved in type VI secretion and phage assembly
MENNNRCLIDNNKKYFGKYRGEVSQNQDEKNLGRIRAYASLGGEQRIETGWALPSFPYAGKKVGFYFIPPVGASVWMEFEAGLLENPIWTGCFWNENEQIEEENLGPEIKIIQTNFATIKINDSNSSPEIKIKTESNLEVTLTSDEIKLTTNSQPSAKISIKNNTVVVNDGALEVQ